MSGNEYYATKPRAAQNGARIAAGSPLAVVGIFLESLRELFRADNNMPFTWHPDPSVSQIQIEAGYNVNVEARNAKPALYVNRLDTTPVQLAIGDRAGVRLPDHLEGFAAMMRSTMSIDCTSTRAGESMLLGDIAQHFVMASSDILQAQYGFHDVSMPQLGQTAPFAHDQDAFASSVTFVVQYHARWSTVKIRPLLEQVALRATDAETFSDTARVSLGRSLQWYSDLEAEEG